MTGLVSTSPRVSKRSDSQDDGPTRLGEKQAFLQEEGYQAEDCYETTQGSTDNIKVGEDERRHPDHQRRRLARSAFLEC